MIQNFAIQSSMMPLILFGSANSIICGIGSGSWCGIYSGSSSGDNCIFSAYGTAGF